MARTTKRQQGAQGDRGLAGKTGPAGPRGKQGLRGKIGQRGERGQTGATGQRGERGKSGPSGAIHITRAEFETALEDIAESVRTLQVQFRRMADLQADVDVLKRVVERLADKVKQASRDVVTSV